MLAPSKLLQDQSRRAPAASPADAASVRRRGKKTRRRSRCCAPCCGTAKGPYDFARCCCICLPSSVLSSQALHGAVRSLRAVKVCACKPSTNTVCVLLTACHRGALQLENIAGLAQR